MSTEAITAEQQKAIDINTNYAKRHKDSLVKSFCPTFYYHAREDSFPTDPDIYIKDVIMAKHAEYTKPGKKLNDEEVREFKWIKDYFLTADGKFKDDWKPNYDDPEWKKILGDPNFLTFDEKAYGYQLGDRVPIKGLPLTGPKKPSIYYAITPTPDGIMIKYQYFYAVSSAVPGTKWLHKLLPKMLVKKASNFAVHAGDWEGATVYVKIDNGQASLDGLLPFAHGRDGAHIVKKDDITYDENGHPSIFVGQQTHGSYVDNFVVRSKFADVVGNKHKLVADKFTDLTPTAEAVAAKFNVCQKGAELTEEEAKTLPRWASFSRIGDTSHMLFAREEYAANYTEYLSASKEWNRYKPNLVATKVWNKVKSFLTAITGRAKAKPPKISIDLVAKSREQDYSPVIEQLRTKERGNPKSFVEAHNKRESIASTTHSVGK